MIKRKDMLKAAFHQEPVQSDAGPVSHAAQNTARVSSGAVRAMGLSLGRLKEDVARVDALSAQLERGELIQDLETQVVDPSFVDDRIARTADADFRRLVESIESAGQQVPILVRPHPASKGRYQVAYGHRRLEACMELGRVVKAIVRSLTDTELVVAQGKENAERRNLSFIERATFASQLEKQGFERAIIQSALAVHPAEMTRLLAVARSIPLDVINAIGPAPRVGRPRWIELSALLEQKGALERVRNLVVQESFLRIGSDTKFEFLLSQLRTPASDAAAPVLFRDERGRVLIRAENSALGFRLLIDQKLAPGLDHYVLEKLPALLAAFHAETVDSRDEVLQ